jgi:hypothetical protein
MAVYFVREAHVGMVKIGVSKDVPQRLKALRTGNPRPLELMGWIIPQKGSDYSLESQLHLKYDRHRAEGEWFRMSSTEVLDELRGAHTGGFVSKNAKAFEIVERDRDGVPIYLGVCKWTDLEIDECCPYCGCMCGLIGQETGAMYHCLNCDAYTDLSDLPD